MSDNEDDRPEGGAPSDADSTQGASPPAASGAPLDANPPRARVAERQAQLRGILDEFMVEVARDASLPKPSAIGPFDPRPYIAIVAAILCISVWAFRPTELSLPADPTVLAEREAGIRLAMYLTSQRIQTFREATDSLPAIYDDSSGIAYTRLSEEVYQLSYQMQGEFDLGYPVDKEQIIIYNSLITPGPLFLGNAAERLIPSDGRGAPP